MKVCNNVSVQLISWVKSNKRLLDEQKGIERLYYPETITELEELLRVFIGYNVKFDLIGFSSNTLFLPSYKVSNVICTKYVNDFKENVDSIICDCGVPVSKIAKYAVDKGYIGFEGLLDLPGTIGAAVYGNCGCRGCSINALVNSFTMMDETGMINDYTVEELKQAYRSTSLKRGELKGTILQVTLEKKQGDANKLKILAEKNHIIRKMQQPTGANNLGTTFNGGAKKTLKGYILCFLEYVIQFIIGNRDVRISFPLLLKVIGQGRFAPYVYYWNRYMFIDERSHDLFPKYYSFLKSLYKDVCLEIEIRK